MADHTSTPAVRGAVTSTNIGGGYAEILTQNVSHYAKFLVPLISAALITFQQLYGHGTALFIVLSIAIAIGQAIATYRFSQGSSIGTSLKFWANVIGTVAQAILLLIGSGGDIADITPIGWATVGLAALSALGVAVIPNGPQFSQQIVQAGLPDPVTGENIVTPIAAPAAPTAPGDAS